MLGFVESAKGQLKARSRHQQTIPYRPLLALYPMSLKMMCSSTGPRAVHARQGLVLLRHDFSSPGLSLSMATVEKFGGWVRKASHESGSCKGRPSTGHRAIVLRRLIDHGQHVVLLFDCLIVRPLTRTTGALIRCSRYEPILDQIVT